MVERKSESATWASIDTDQILQFRVWLIGISPMIWRRVQVPSSMTLRELHGTFQVAMGWEGIHLFQFNLRAARYGSHELAARSPDIRLEVLRLRRSGRFTYEYNLNIPWAHEVRLEERLPRGQVFPYCIGGNGNCPWEECDGPISFLEQRDALYWNESLDDLRTLADFVDHVVLQGNIDLLKKAETREEIREVLERSEQRQSWQGKPFSRRAVNTRLRQGDYPSARVRFLVPSIQQIGYKGGIIALSLPPVPR